MTQIKEILKTGLFAIIVLCSSVACSNDNEIKDTSYTFDGIQWAMLYDDKVEETIIDVTPEIYENGSSSTITVTMDPAMDYEQVSQFYYDDPKYFQLLNPTVNEVSIPTGNLIFDDFRYLSGGQTVPFTLEEYAYLSDNHVEESITVPPHCTLYYDATIIKREVTATYRAYFIGDETNERIEITGKWKGTFYRNNESVIRIEEIK